MPIDIPADGDDHIASAFFGKGPKEEFVFWDIMGIFILQAQAVVRLTSIRDITGMMGRNLASNAYYSQHYIIFWRSYDFTSMVFW